VTAPYIFVQVAVDETVPMMGMLVVPLITVPLTLPANDDERELPLRVALPIVKESVAVVVVVMVLELIAHVWPGLNVAELPLAVRRIWQV
jgi:hypothetical protein